MKTERLELLGIEISLEDFLKSMKLELEEEDRETLQEMLTEAGKLARPKAIYGMAPIEEKGEDYIVADGIRLTSERVRRNVDKVNRIVPYVATCGTELEQWAERITDPLEAYWADGIMLRSLMEIRKVLRETVKSKYFPAGDLSFMSPGSLPEWPLKEQEAVFGLLGDVAGEIGVRLTDSYLMIPRKSGSGIFFSAQTHYEDCQYCERLDCPGRRAKKLE